MATRSPRSSSVEAEDRLKSHIVIGDDQPEIRDALVETLQANGRDVHAYGTGVQVLNYVRDADDPVSLVILDLDFGPNEPDGLEILRLLKEQHPDLPVIILTGKGTVETAVTALHYGAIDFIEKDFYVEDRLELSVGNFERGLEVAGENEKLREEVAELGQENRFYRDEFGKQYQVVGTGTSMTQILQQAKRIAPIPRPTLILGEPGTGKELVAATIHYSGNRRDRPFVKVNCAALSSNLLESELFGHEKGAFGGAGEARPGKFKAAHGGTLFLDEIGNSSAEFQQNVLRAIENQEVQRVGSATPVKLDVRVIAATNADLEQEIAEGRFRQDLYDRLRFEVLRIPPLRDRHEDVPELAAHFVNEIPGVTVRPFDAAALEALQAYHWPGNVRELKFAAERAACIASGDTLTVADLPSEITEARTAGGEGFKAQMEAYELSLIRRALLASGWNQRKAAESLGLSYDQFRHYYRKHHLSYEKPPR